MAGQQAHHHTFMGGVEVLHQNEGHAGAGRQRVHELPARLETARRRAYPHNQEIRDALSGAARRRARPVRSRAIRFGPMRAACWHPANFPKHRFSMGEASRCYHNSSAANF
jgi:hypothetical protein